MIVGAVLSILDIEVQESDINDVIRIHLQQPLAVLFMRIILRVIRREQYPCIGGIFSAASGEHTFVTGIESSRRIRHVGMELQEHLVPEAGIYHRLL